VNRIKHAAARRPVVIAATLASLAAALLASLALAARPEPPPERRGPCNNANSPAAELTRAEMRRAVRCLINAERTDRDRTKLTRSRELQLAAQRHATTMAATDCLAHTCGDEVDLAERIRRAGYLVGADSWQYAESTGCGASPKAMVANWMSNRFHRVNILEKTYRDVGVGAVAEPVPSRCDEAYATFAVVFGWRTPPPASSVRMTRS
jgi:uncharacterized protein YkwD